MASDATNLARAQDAFDARLRPVGADQWALATPCTGWTVRELVNHVVVGGMTSVRLLHGATVEDLGSLWGSDQLGADPLATRRRSVADERAAFAEPGALERIVHHPAGDVPGSTLLGFRTADNLLHAWDLAELSAATRPSTLTSSPWCGRGSSPWPRSWRLSACSAPGRAGPSVPTPRSRSASSTSAAAVPSPVRRRTGMS